MARKKFFGALRSRRKLLSIWGFFAFLAFLSSSGVNVHDENTLVAFEDQVISLLVLLIRGAVLVLGLYVAYLFVRRRQNSKTESGSGFRDVPQHYDRRVIRLYAKVEKVFTTRLEEKVRKGITNAVRTLTNDDDNTGRHVHQRFLVSSPMLRNAERLLVLHNVSYGKCAVREGAWVAVQGVYLHDRTKKRTWFGGSRLTYYGKLHFTHKPKGFIKVLDQKPPPEHLRAVIVDPKPRKSNTPAEAASDGESLRRVNS